ncbi:hypothetical protein [Larkinella soli]|uniref:hypothetical protein n=1 Tax=Larkinella soli TaxID=1770527 RepID=UPI000FFB578D|nr:hypothetical protein [Larkinella soli]
MENLYIYCFRKHYKILPCSTIQEGLQRLTDLGLVDGIEPIGVYNPKSRRMVWHPYYEVGLREAGRHHAQVTKLMITFGAAAAES